MTSRYQRHLFSDMVTYPHRMDSVAWASGFTALIGLREIGQLKPNDAILVSGAAGGVGSQVAQVAKALGAKRVVGIAGGQQMR